MDYSGNNLALWNFVIQFGIIAVVILFSNIIRKKVLFIRKSLVPTSVLAGFLLLGVKYTGLVRIDTNFLEQLTYHGIAIGFISMSLRVPKKDETNTVGTAVRSGCLIVSTYLVQAVTGLIISLLLAYTIKPDLFKAAGVLLPMGFGQGPGQANNVGLTYEALGFTGGQSFGLALAAAGFLCACIVGVIYLNFISRKGYVKREAHQDVSGSVTVDTFQDKDEIPISESIDKLSIQMALILLVYLFTYLVLQGVSVLLQNKAPGVAKTICPLLWGFNFIFGSIFAVVARKVIVGLRKSKLMNRQYQNNYLLSRISGLAFDVMIISGIASIDFKKLQGLWLPFILMAVAGGVVTFIWVMFMCKRIYPDYVQEGFLGMYGMLTGTISSGILLVREIDPNFETPAANNLVAGSGLGIAFGAPVLLLISLAPKSAASPFIVIGLAVAYLAVLLGIIAFSKKKSRP